MNTAHGNIAKADVAQPGLAAIREHARAVRVRPRRIHRARKRFFVLPNYNNEAVLDHETHLVWERSPSTRKFPWKTQLLASLYKAIGGREGWRMPTAEEMRTLRTPSAQTDLKLPAGHPFTNILTGADDVYWTTTTYADDFASVVSFGAASAVVGGNKQVLEAPIWCVRGPGNRS